MSYKRIYNFDFEKEIKQNIEKIVKNEDGTETKVIEEAVKKENYKFFVRKPTRSLRDEAELFKGRKYAEAIKSDLLPAALISKRLINDQGIFLSKKRNSIPNLKRSYLINKRL